MHPWVGRNGGGNFFVRSYCLRSTSNDSPFFAKDNTRPIILGDDTEASRMPTRRGPCFGRRFLSFSVTFDKKVLKNVTGYQLEACSWKLQVTSAPTAHVPLDEVAGVEGAVGRVEHGDLRKVRVGVGVRVRVKS